MLFFKDTAQVLRANDGLFWAGETTRWCQCVDGASPALVLCRHVHILVATRCRGGILTPRREDALQRITSGGWWGGGLFWLWLLEILFRPQVSSTGLMLPVCISQWLSGEVKVLDDCLGLHALFLDCHFMNLKVKPINHVTQLTPGIPAMQCQIL